MKYEINLLNCSDNEIKPISETSVNKQNRLDSIWRDEIGGRLGGEYSQA